MHGNNTSATETLNMQLRMELTVLQQQLASEREQRGERDAEATYAMHHLEMSVAVCKASSDALSNDITLIERILDSLNWFLSSLKPSYEPPKGKSA